jgi:hypothetical protein
MGPQPEPVAADAKIRRAIGHLNEFNAMEASWHAEGPHHVEVVDDPDGADRDRWVYRAVGRTLPAVDLGMVLGDAVHNLRSALDHLVWRLVHANDPSSAGKNTSFPAFRDPGSRTAAEVRSLVERCAKGASKPVREELASLEPFEGGRHELLWALNYLDIVDKHRVLLTAAGAVRQVEVDYGGVMDRLAEGLGFPAGQGAMPDLRIGINQAETTFPVIDGTVLFSASPKGHFAGNEVAFPIFVALGEPDPLRGHPAGETIARLVGAVREVVATLRVHL